MKDRPLPVLPYEGDEPYLYFAFAEADRRRVWKQMIPLLKRGCRIWYSIGAAGSSEELLRRQARAKAAVLTVLYLSDAACSDKDTKSNILVNQKNKRPILCLDPDGRDRRLSMGLREDTPHIPLYRTRGDAIESAVIHAEGFSQEVLGAPIEIPGEHLPERLAALFCVLALLTGALIYVGTSFFHWFSPEPEDSVQIFDTAIRAAVRAETGGAAITEETLGEIHILRMEELPESWDELSLFPALEILVLPQQALLDGAVLPGGDYTIELSGGSGT